MVSDVTSLSPSDSSSCTIFDTVCSMRSGSTLRLRSAISTERASLSRSNGRRRPLRLITVSSRSCTRSKVVKRKLHDRQTRRRRIAAESSVGRESFTCVSRLWHFGQRIGLKIPSRRCAPTSPFSGEDEKLRLIDRKALHQRLHLVAYRGLDQR